MLYVVVDDDDGHDATAVDTQERGKSNTCQPSMAPPPFPRRLLLGITLVYLHKEGPRAYSTYVEKVISRSKRLLNPPPPGRLTRLSIYSGPIGIARNDVLVITAYIKIPNSNRVKALGRNSWDERRLISGQPVATDRRFVAIVLIGSVSLLG
ncbi:hypothetical protein LX36DRAFT_4497 [Colletotrichum falcatum]|nr:hypothetical protein LX36DRAFT_4497 [Colletotrichum falcatum]